MGSCYSVVNTKYSKSRLVRNILVIVVTVESKYTVMSDGEKLLKILYSVQTQTVFIG